MYIAKLLIVAKQNLKNYKPNAHQKQNEKYIWYTMECDTAIKHADCSYVQQQARWISET